MGGCVSLSGPHRQPSRHPMPYWRQCDACRGWGVVRTVANQQRRDELLRTAGWHFTSATGAMICPGCWDLRSHPDRVITDIP